MTIKWDRLNRMKEWAAGTLLVAAALVGAGADCVQAQTFPSRPVKIIVQTAAGSSIDVAARVLADNLSKVWGQQAYVVNQPGAGGALAAKALAAAAPDGETLLFAASSIFVALPEIQKAQAASIASFVPVSLVGEQPMAIAIGAKEKEKTLAELLATVRKTPGGLNCAVSTRGGLSHLSAAALQAATGTEMNFIHYPGTAQALSDVISGRVPIVIDSLTAFVGPAAGGQIRILGVASAERLKKMPDVPTVAETVPGFEAAGWFVLAAPAGTPPAVIAKIGADTDRVLSDPAVVSRMEDLGTFVHRLSGPPLVAYIKAQRDKWSPIVRKYGVTK